MSTEEMILLIEPRWHDLGTNAVSIDTVCWETYEIDIRQRQQIAKRMKALLAVVEAADAIAVQYQGLLEWIADPECECCHCDDHDKLVKVLEAYRKAKVEL